MIDTKTYCVGNDRVFIEHEYTVISARCFCQSTVKLLANGQWVHGIGRDGRINTPLCPAYDCQCGQRHN